MNKLLLVVPVLMGLLSAGCATEVDPTDEDPQTSADAICIKGPTCAPLPPPKVPPTPPTPPTGTVTYAGTFHHFQTSPSLTLVHFIPPVGSNVWLQFQDALPASDPDATSMTALMQGIRSGLPLSCSNDICINDLQTGTITLDVTLTCAPGTPTTGGTIDLRNTCTITHWHVFRAGTLIASQP